MTCRNICEGLYPIYIKRGLDIVLSATAITVLLPIMGITGIAVRSLLGSPVLYVQERPGKDEKPFKLIKFRTMTDAKDADGKLLPDRQRLTPFGRFLRSTSFDELPELINIIKGDMSIVGPRPLAIVYLPYYTDRERKRHSVRPGLTGLAQVNGRNSISWSKKFDLDLEYVNNISFINDLRIIILTVGKVIKREDICQGEQIPLSLHLERANWLDANGVMKEEYRTR